MSETVKTWTQWLKDSRFAGMTEEQIQQTLSLLFEIRDKVLDRANLKPDDILIDIGTGSGLLAFGAHERLKEMHGTGKAIASDAFDDCIEECFKTAKECGMEHEMGFLKVDALNTDLPDNSVDVVVMRSVSVHIINKPKAINEFFRILKPGGRISIFEPVMTKNTKYYELITPEKYPDYEGFKKAEIEMTSDINDPLMNFDEDSIKKDFETAGFKNIDIETVVQASTYRVSKEMIEPWFNTPPSPGNPTIKEKYLRYFSEEKVNNFIETMKLDLDGKTITINTPTIYVYAEKV